MDAKARRKVWNNAKTIAVLCSSGIGDSLMATPLIEELKKRHPKIRLIVVSTETYAQVFERNPAIDCILKYSHTLKSGSFLEFIDFILRLRKERIDIFFAAQPSNTINHSIIAALSGAKLRLKHSYDYGASNERDFSFVYNSLLPDSMEKHRVELNLEFLRFLGENVQEKSSRPIFYISDDADKKMESWLMSNGKSKLHGNLVAIHPGGVRENKRWMPDRFAEMGKELIKRGFVVCLVGGKDEKDLCDYIEDMIKKDAVHNVAGEFVLEETAALLKKCLFLLSNDTGIMHLATAVGTPVIAIFGPTDCRHIGPYGEKAIVISKNNNIQDVLVSDVLDVIDKDILLKKFVHKG